MPLHPQSTSQIHHSFASEPVAYANDAIPPRAIPPYRVPPRAQSYVRSRVREKSERDDDADTIMDDASAIRKTDARSFEMSQAAGSLVNGVKVTRESKLNRLRQ